MGTQVFIDTLTVNDYVNENMYFNSVVEITCVTITIIHVINCHMRVVARGILLGRAAVACNCKRRAGDRRDYVKLFELLVSR